MSIRKRVIAAGALALATLLTACGSSGSASKAPTLDAKTIAAIGADAPFTSPFVGEVTGTNTFIAIAVRDGQAWAYLCDGEAGKAATVASYLTGTSDGKVVNATDPDAADASSNTMVAATIDGDKATGTVTLPGGATASFTATKSTGKAGWLAAVAHDAKQLEVGSWIRLADGRVRGKVTVQTTETASGGSAAGNEPAGPPTQVTGNPPANAVPTGVFKCMRATRAFDAALTKYRAISAAADINNANDMAAEEAALDALGAARDARNAACGL